MWRPLGVLDWSLSIALEQVKINLLCVYELVEQIDVIKTIYKGGSLIPSTNNL